MAFHIHFIWAEVLFWNTKNCLFRIWILRVFHSNTYQTIMAQFNSTLWKNWKSVVLCLALLVLIVTEAAPAKGGSKSMMKNRWISVCVCNLGNNFRGGSKGSGSRGRGVSNHPSGEDGDSGVGGSGIRTDKPPCVGLCYYNKLHGIPLESTTPRWVNSKNDFNQHIVSESFIWVAFRQPCIGLCYLNKLRLSKGLSGIKWRRGWESYFGKSSSLVFLLQIIINCIYCDLIFTTEENYLSTMSCPCQL